MSDRNLAAFFSSAVFLLGLIWWLIGMLLAAMYFILTYRLFRGKVNVVAEWRY